MTPCKQAGPSGHASPPFFPYPKWVWSPTGGWWPHPSAWRRNTFIVGLGLILINIPIFLFSEANEEIVYSSKERDEEYYRKKLQHE